MKSARIILNPILLCTVFIGLNILDAWLTGLALGAGSHELNFIISIRFGTSMLFKGLVSAAIVAALVFFERGWLLKPLSLLMLLICIWNGLTICFWS
jgi:hypothetical protein